MKRIGIFLGSEPSGGGTFQYNLAMLDAVASLPDKDYDVVAIYVDPLWKTYISPYGLRASSVSLGFWGRAFGKVWRTCGLPIEGWRTISQFIHPVARKLTDQNCDLWIFPSQDTWSYQVNVSALATIHDLMHRYEPEYPEVSANGEYRKREIHYSNTCRWASGVLVDSEVGKMHVHESYGLPLNKIFILPFIPPTYVYNNKVSDNFDARYTLPPKYIFYPAQFWEHKNHVRLVKAIYLLRNELPDIHLVLVGSKKGGYDKVVQTVQEYGLKERVHFMGYVPDEDIPEFYRRAKAMVMPTLFGPTNIPQLEAFVLGCPVATSRIYGIPEQVEDAALLFDPRSNEEIADCIRQLWTDDDLCKNLVEKGFQKAAAWGQQQFNQRVLEIITQLV